MRTATAMQLAHGIEASASGPPRTAAAAAGGADSPAAVWPDFLVGQPEKPVRVVVVDDDTHIRRIIAQELMGDPRTLLVGQAGSLREGRRIVREHDFDVILVDLNLGDGRGYDLIAYVKEVRSSAEAVVVSVLEADEDAIRAFELGASGFLVKNSWFGGFVQSVLQVANGGASITPSLARRLLLRLDRGGLARLSAPRTQGKLSEREREILRMISGGMTSTEIGARLGISHMTVNTHVKNIYQKLHVRNRAQAVNCANRWGFL
jgi:DNA-binding NarL/FixJ family response regulator